VNRVRRSLAAPLLASGVLLLGLLPAAAATPPPYQHIGTVTEPNASLDGGFSSFDISFVDNKRDVYYLADRAGCTTNNVPCTGTFVHGRIVVVDADDGAFIKYIGTNAFAGTFNNPASGLSACAETPRDPRNGPNGVLTDDDGTVWVGDGNRNTGGCGGTFATSRIMAFNSTTGALIKELDNGGNRRADEAAFGNVGGGRILFGNPEEVKPSFPFETLVNTETKAIIGKIFYDQPAPPVSDADDHRLVPSLGHGWDSSLQDTGGNGGLEQSVWDPDDHVFLLNVPATTLNPGGEIDVISPNADNDQNGRVLKVFPMGVTDDATTGPACNGTGLAISGNDLIVQCGGDVRILNEKTGKLVQRFIEGAGGDEIWFNPGDGNVYQGIFAPPGLGILDVRARKYIGVVTVPNVVGVHSVAADARTNRILLPIGGGSVAGGNSGNGGIMMFHKDDREP
jgi:hypothetical protein